MSWSVEKSTELYGIKNWGAGYFCINNEGHIEIRPKKSAPGLDLYKLVQDLRERGLRPPILVRIPNLVENRVSLISNCFYNAIRENGYKGHCSGVYPVKVNQQKHLLEEIVDFGKDHNLGLECGS